MGMTSKFFCTVGSMQKRDPDTPKRVNASIGIDRSAKNKQAPNNLIPELDTSVLDFFDSCELQ